MLNKGIDTKLLAVVTTDVTATSTTFVETGMSIYLSANTSYAIDCLLDVNCDTAGIRFSLEYDGAATITGMVWDWGIDHQIVTVDVPCTYSIAFVGPFTVRGYINTSTGGLLRVQVRKNTDLGTDTIIAAGSYLRATAL